jgi:hypothetical protein
MRTGAQDSGLERECLGFAPWIAAAKQEYVAMAAA